MSEAETLAQALDQGFKILEELNCALAEAKRENDELKAQLKHISMSWGITPIVWRDDE